MRILMRGKSYPQKNNGINEELMVKDTIVHGRRVNARIKMD